MNLEYWVYFVVAFLGNFQLTTPHIQSSLMKMNEIILLGRTRDEEEAEDSIVYYSSFYLVVVIYEWHMTFPLKVFSNIISSDHQIKYLIEMCLNLMGFKFCTCCVIRWCITVHYWTENWVNRVIIVISPPSPRHRYCKHIRYHYA